MFRKNSKTNFNRPHTTAIIVAAGNSTRMNLEESKQFVLIDEMPVLAHTLLKFSRADSIDDIIIVTRDEDILLVNDLVREFEISKVKSIIPGGKTRQESVYLGLQIVPIGCIVAIHDGARPFITSEKINELIDIALMEDAVTLGVNLKDTVKQVSEDGIIVSTPDRRNLRQIQTPQVFKSDIIKLAHIKARDQGYIGTDDCSLAELIGVSVRVAEGDYNNIKITTPEDIGLAEYIHNKFFK